MTGPAPIAVMRELIVQDWKRRPETWPAPANVGAWAEWALSPAVAAWVSAETWYWAQAVVLAERSPA